MSPAIGANPTGFEWASVCSPWTFSGSLPEQAHNFFNAPNVISNASFQVYSGDIGNTSFRDMGNSFEPKGSPIGSSLQVSSSG